jgi:hypothetical protein
MNAIRSVLLLGFLCVLAGAEVQASTNLLPGLLYRDPPGKLQGSLVFLYSTNGYWSAKATIYEFDLEKKTLRFVIECPGGDFDAGMDGQVFCVRYGVVNGFGHFITNAFVYSKRLGITRTLAFEKCPSQVTFEADRVFFHFDRQVVDYDIQAERSNQLSLGPRGSQPDASSAVPENFHPFGFKTVSGRWLFFEGGDGALEGTRLVSSALNAFDTRFDDPKGKNVRVLKRFSKPLRGSYNLDQMSPCGRFGLVRRSFPIGDGWGQTYYVINAENGETQALLEDKVCSIGESRISYVHLVKGASTAR